MDPEAECVNLVSKSKPLVQMPAGENSVTIFTVQRRRDDHAHVASLLLMIFKQHLRYQSN